VACARASAYEVAAFLVHWTSWTPFGASAMFCKKSVSERHPPSPLHQRLALGLFVVIGLMTFGLGAVRLSKSIGDPLRLKGGGSGFKSAEETEREKTEKLRGQDTDGDTLNDYDELYVFKTSPFLDDTDSDGENDGKEVASESDPNCPKGKTCRAERIAAAPTAVDPTSVTTSSAGVTGGTGTTGTLSAGAPLETPKLAEQDEIADAIEEYVGDPNTLTAPQIAEGIASLSSTDLRAFIVRLGIPKSVLDKADDATLRLLLNDTLKEMTAAYAGQ